MCQAHSKDLVSKARAVPDPCLMEVQSRGGGGTGNSDYYDTNNNC